MAVEWRILPDRLQRTGWHRGLLNTGVKMNHPKLNKPGYGHKTIDSDWV